MQHGEPLDAVVVGAGLTGLCAAHGLVRAGLRVQVLEAGPRAGGVIGSVQRDGFLYEAGPNSGLDNTPEIGELVDALGLRPRLRYASEVSAKNRYLVRGGRVLAAPSGPGSFVTTPLFSAGAKLGLLRELFAARGDAAQDESIASFVRRRLGPEFLDYAVDPLVGGIYAADPERISLAAAFPALQALEQRHGGLVRGAIASARERRRQGGPKRTVPRSFSFDGGLQVLTDALAATLPLSTATTALRAQALPGGGFELQAQGPAGTLALRCRHLVLATAADAAATLLRGLHPAAAAALAAIDYAPVACVASAYARADVTHALDGFGCLVPRREERRVLGVLFTSSMFEGRAPAGRVLLSSFIGGRRQPELAALPEADVAALAHEENAALLGARGAPLWQVVTRWPRAIPQYERGHLVRVGEAAKAEAALPGLHLCANWRGGVSLGDCIVQGAQVARRIAAGTAAIAC